MNEYAESLRSVAQAAFAAEPVHHEWLSVGRTSLRLVFPRKTDTGFDVAIVAKPWGLYIEGDGWHHAANWTVRDGWTMTRLCEDCLGFGRTLLSADALLDVRYAGRSPYRWRMVYLSEHGRNAEETGLLLFNFFGARRSVRLQNTTLPARHGGVV